MRTLSIGRIGNERIRCSSVWPARERGLDLEEGEWLLAASRERVDRRLGCASFVEYVERLFGYAPRLTQEKLRVAEALEQLPELAAALAKAETKWSSVRELTRVAVPSTQKVWLDAARGRTVRDVERLVSGRVRGSLPTDPADDRLRRHGLRFEVSGEVLAAFRDAMAPRLWLNAMRSGCRPTWAARRRRASAPCRTSLPPFNAKCCAAIAVVAKCRAVGTIRSRFLSDTLDHVGSEADTEVRLRAALDALTAGAFRRAS